MKFKTMLCFFTFLYTYILFIFFFNFRSILGPLNISIKQVRMFQTVPDTSSYVKVRHDSIFKQVMSKITILQNSQSFALVENLVPILTEFSREKNPSAFGGRGVRVSSITVTILEICRVESKVVSSGTNNMLKWSWLL